MQQIVKFHMVEINYILTNSDYVLLQQSLSFHEETRGYFYWYGNPKKAKILDEKAVNKEITINERRVYKNGKSVTRFHVLRIRQSAYSSCKNFYIESNFWFNNRKSNVAALKKIIEKADSENIAHEGWYRVVSGVPVRCQSNCLYSCHDGVLCPDEALKFLLEGANVVVNPIHKRDAGFCSKR